MGSVRNATTGKSEVHQARHRRQVADVAIDDAEQRDDGGLVGGDAVEVAQQLSYQRARASAIRSNSLSAATEAVHCIAVWSTLEHP